MIPQDEPSSVEEFLSQIRKADERVEVENETPIDGDESSPASKDTTIKTGSKSPLGNIKELRKLLAGLIWEFRNLFRNDSWSRTERLRVALLQAKVNHLKEADIFLELQDIQALSKLDMDVCKWIGQSLASGAIKDEPVEEFKKAHSSLVTHLRDIFSLFEDSMEHLEFSNPSKGMMVQVGDLKADLEKMEKDKAILVAELKESCKRFHPEDWISEMTLEPCH